MTLMPHAAYNSYETTTEPHRRVVESTVEIMCEKIPDNAVNKNALTRG